MSFSPQFLDQLRAKLPLHDVIGRRVKLTRAGRGWKSCCPFRREASETLYVYADHYHCFGCGAHGDAIAFLMQTDGMSFAAAVNQLAKEAGIDMPPPVEGITLDGAASERWLFRDGQFDAVLGAAARLLVQQGNMPAASILANGRASIRHWEHDNWNGGQDTWRLFLSIPADSYLQLTEREKLENAIAESISVAVRVLSDQDFIGVEIATELETDPDWRRKTRQALTGEGINNQGRAHSQNVAARSYDNLLFRSRPEICMYRALKDAGIAVAPLSVVVGRNGVGQKPRRVEPDFVLYKDGIVTIVEIDGDSWHTETPQAAHVRLKFLLDEGARMQRINASECDTPEKAREAVDRILRDIEKWRRSKV